METELSTKLERFFNPRSVAFVGATEDQSKFGGKCYASLLKFGFRGKVMPVNPKRESLLGLPCAPSIDQLPEVPDHVGIALPAAASLEALEQCGRLGVPFATIFAAGFLETGTEAGKALQDRLRAICAETGIRVMGPNCNGMVSFVDRFALTSTYAVSQGHVPHGDLGIASQSGGAGQINVMWRAMQAGMGISYQVSCGNDADLDLLDYIDFMVDSEATRVVLTIAERISSSAKLKAVAEKAARRDKPILMLKVGRSEAGSAAAASHTGSITGADDVADAALEQYGIIRVDDTTDLYEFAKLFRRSTRPAGRRISASSVSGGNLVQAVDLASLAGLQWPEFGPTATTGLATLLPGFGKVRNPIDLTAAAVGSDDLLVLAGKHVLADPGIDTYVPVITMARRVEIEGIANLALTHEKQPVVLWTGECVDDKSYDMKTLVRLGVPVFDDPSRCFRAIAASARLHELRAAMRRDAEELKREALVAPAIAELPPLHGKALTERESKRWVAAYGLPVTVEELATSADQAAAIAARIGGPVALKIESPDILHKTEAGAIRLGVQGVQAVRESFEAVMQAARAYSPQANLQGVLVQEMAPPGLELVLGMVRDPVFGPVVMVGAGGIYVEVLRDVARRLVPVTEQAARDMLRALRIWPILAGARGQDPYDVDSVVKAIVGLSRLAQANPHAIAEIDINPLIVQRAGRGAKVVDALVVPVRD
jgi:acetyltransferase